MEALQQREITTAWLVSHNIRRWRTAAGMSQIDLGGLLGWPNRAVSAAERVAAGGRPWKFGADQLSELAAALGVPLLALFLPPEDEGIACRYVLADGTSMAAVMTLVMPDSDSQAPVMDTYRRALTSSVERLLDPGWGPEVARWMTDMDGPEVRAARLLRLRGVIAELDDLATAMAGDPDE